MWDQRYATDDYVYGTQPIPFLVETASDLPIGQALCIGAGEGRNAVWLAEQGHETTALDISSVGLEKARKLALERGVSLTTELADASAFDPGKRRWGIITVFYLHLPPQQRHEVYTRISESLAPGGHLIIQGFTPRQFGRGTGGPGSAHSPSDHGIRDSEEDPRPRFIEPQELRNHFGHLDILRLEEVEIPLIGGVYHTGTGVVVRFVGRNPKTS